MGRASILQVDEESDAAHLVAEQKAFSLAAWEGHPLCRWMKNRDAATLMAEQSAFSMADWGLK